jgi:hypothetical protein
MPHNGCCHGILFYFPPSTLVSGPDFPSPLVHFGGHDFFHKCPVDNTRSWAASSRTFENNTFYISRKGAAQDESAFFVFVGPNDDVVRENLERWRKNRSPRKHVGSAALRFLGNVIFKRFKLDSFLG